jgi:folate-binding protein YgfZ
MTNTSSSGQTPFSFSGKVYRCPLLQTFTVRGADATAFLQGQLTQDIAQQTSDRAQFAGYCTAQGRVLSTMVLTRNDHSEPEYQCFTHVSVAQALIKRLRMFVMRSKVVITEAVDLTESQISDPLIATPLGVVGVRATDATDVRALEASLKHTLPQLPWHQQEHATGRWVCAPSAAGQSLRWWWLASAQQKTAIVAIDGLHEALEANLTPWQQFDVQAGLPWVEQTTQDLFIAQTLNLDLMGAVSFTKGCYPGQEVVARAHYRGTLKRRMYLGHIDQALKVELASDVLSAANPNEPCGRIISFVIGENRTDILFESTIGAANQNELYLAALSDEQPQVKIVIDALPYAYS